MDKDKKQILNRLKRIEGQIRGLQRMVENDAPCVDILTQLSATTSAMKKAGVAVIQAYMTHCLHKTASDRQGSLDKFEKALARYVSMS